MSEIYKQHSSVEWNTLEIFGLLTWPPLILNLLRGHRINYIAEIVLIMCPIVVSSTILPKVSESASIVTSLALLVYFLFNLSSNFIDDDKKINEKARGKPMEFTLFRSLTMIYTLICILAVDFNIFPLRFAKSKELGISLMDLGVGFFIISSALGTAFKLKLVRTNVNRSVKKIGIVLLLGSLRTLSVKMTGYVEHVEEYGVHWNFFFTLAFVMLLFDFTTRILDIFQKPSEERGLLTRSLIHLSLGALTLILYQYALTIGGLQDWIFSAERVDFISMNREGIFSAIGYFSLHEIAVGVTSLAFQLKTWNAKSLSMFFLSSLFLFFCSRSVFGDPSRRVVNLPYVACILAFAGFLLFLLVMLDLAKAPAILHEINNNQLLIFLVGNLVTGLLNLSIDTKKVGDLPALVILVIYISFLSSFSLVFQSGKIKSK